MWCEGESWLISVDFGAYIFFHITYLLEVVAGAEYELKYELDN